MSEPVRAFLDAGQNDAEILGRIGKTVSAFREVVGEYPTVLYMPVEDYYALLDATGKSAVASVCGTVRVIPARIEAMLPR